MKNNIKSIVVLTAICSVIAVAMGVVNLVTYPIIEKNEAAIANQSLVVVMPNGEGFEKIDITKYQLPDSVTDVYSEKSGGYVIQCVTSGYASGLTVMCGIDKDGVVTGATCISSGETLGVEKDYGTKTVGATMQTVNDIEAVAGATKTCNGYKAAVNDALKSFVVLNGGSIDLRDEAQILADNLKAALPSSNGECEELFITEKLNNVSAVYSATNGSGYVFVFNQTYIGINAEGQVVTSADDATKVLATDAYSKLSASTLSDIDISGHDFASYITKAQKTATGNYVFEIKAAGFGINGDAWYNPSGEYIIIKISISAAGEVIAVKTLSQKETDGIGSACENNSFYTQFVGKTEADYKDIDSISGATITTNAYKTAVGRAIAAAKILGGAN